MWLVAYLPAQAFLFSIRVPSCSVGTMFCHWSCTDIKKHLQMEWVWDVPWTASGLGKCNSYAVILKSELSLRKTSKKHLSSHLHRPSPGEAWCMYDTWVCLKKTVAWSIQVEYLCTAVLLKCLSLSGWIPGFQPSSLSTPNVRRSHLCLFPSVPNTGPWEEAGWVPHLKQYSTNKIECCKQFCCICIKGWI